MSLTILQFVVSAAVIVIAGTYLTRYADAIADLTGLGRLLVGSILLAGATSFPELSVDLSAVRLGEVDMAVGNLIGSSLFNLLILGILDLSHHSRGRMLSRASAAHALSATLSIALTAIAAMSILIGTRAAQTFVGLGMGSWALLITYVLGVRMVYYDQRLSAKVAETSQEVLIPAGRIRLIRAGMGFALAALVIVVASPHLARSAAKIADETGLEGRLRRNYIGGTLHVTTGTGRLLAGLAARRLRHGRRECLQSPPIP